VLPGLLALSAMNNSFGPVSTSVNVSKLYTKTIEEVANFWVCLRAIP
jgi:hypothetical protein